MRAWAHFICRDEQFAQAIHRLVLNRGKKARLVGSDIHGLQGAGVMMLRRKTVCCQAGGKGGSGKFGQSQLFALIVWHSACGGCSDNIPGEIRRTRCEDIAVAFVSTELHDAARNHVISGIPLLPVTLNKPGANRGTPTWSVPSRTRRKPKLWPSPLQHRLKNRLCRDHSPPSARIRFS